MSSWFIGSDLEGNVGLQTDALKAIIAGIRSSSLWIALAIAVILLVIGLIVNLKFKDKFRNFLTIAISIPVGFSVALVSVLLVLQIGRLELKGELNLNFYLWLGFASLVVLSAITLAVMKIFKSKLFKPFAIGLALLSVAYMIVLLFLYPTEDGYAPINGSDALFIILSVALVLLLIALTFIFDRKSSKENNTKSLTYAGICIAVSYALSYIKLFDGPQGSSVTLLSMLPILLYSYMFGTKKGVIAGLVYGILQALQDPQIYQPLQVMLDYPIAFAGLGLAGMFKNNKLFKGKKILEFVFGIFVAGLFRYVAHVLSGYFVFYSYAEWAGMSDPLLYSIVYNTGVLIDMALDLVAGFLLLSSKTMMHQIQSVSPLE